MLTTRSPKAANPKIHRFINSQIHRFISEPSPAKGPPPREIRGNNTRGQLSRPTQPKELSGGDGRVSTEKERRKGIFSSLLQPVALARHVLDVFHPREQNPDHIAKILALGGIASGKGHLRKLLWLHGPLAFRKELFQ
jgi:hypothetical protein